jgi:hypothetical protein
MINGKSGEGKVAFKKRPGHPLRPILSGPEGNRLKPS